MANSRSGNTYYVDTSSDSSDVSTYISDKNLKLIGVLYTMNATTDVISIYDKSPSSVAAGRQKIKIMNATAKNTSQLRLEECSPVFPNGVWITITSGATCTLIFTQAQGQ